jgi:aminodeoxyfutalosine deaminase
MPYYRAAWLLPISQPPIRDGWIRTEEGRITAFGHCRPGDLTEPDEIDLGNVAVLPALVNAHTHLELSWMRGCIGPAASFGEWVRALIDLRRSAAGDHERVRAAIPRAIQEARAFGTGVVGDVSNTLQASEFLAGSRMAGIVFYELLGFVGAEAAGIVAQAAEHLRRAAPRGVPHVLAPHAPYSVSPQLFGEIRRTLQGSIRPQSTLHLGESAGEVEFLSDGTGWCRHLLDDLGKWDGAWAVPRCGPVDYIDRMGFLNAHIMLVHGVHFTADEIARVARVGATVVSCPRGNQLTGAGEPPIAELFDAGVCVAVGTDSLASVPDLNVFAELSEMRRLAPDVPARRLLESATINGARALGFDAEYGTIDAGKRDALLVVQLDGSSGSRVEEYLVSGIDAGQIDWIAPS